MDASRIGGIVLCGGRSSRMGRPKAWLPVAGETMLARTVRLVREVVSPVIVAAAEGQDLPPLPQDVRIARDVMTDRGPLGGIVTAMANIGFDAALVVACDLPMMTTETLRAIVEGGGFTPAIPEPDEIPTVKARRTDDALAYVPRIHGEAQPLAAVYRCAAWPILYQQLMMNRFSMRQFLARIAVTWINDLDPTAFVNVNTRDEYEPFA